MAIATLATLPKVYTSIEKAKAVVAVYLTRPEPVYFDTETSGLDPRSDKLAAILLKQGDNPSIIFDVRDRPELVKALSPIFEQATLIGHNLKFDLNWLRQHGIRCSHLFDTQIAEQLIRGKGLTEAADAGMGMNLQATAERYGIPVSKEERAWFYKPGPLHERPEWHEPFPDEQRAYMSQDVDVLGPIAEAQRRELKRLKLVAVMKLEMRTLPALVEMESAGIFIDVDGWRAFIAEKHTEAERLEDEVLNVIGQAILDRRIREYDRATVEWRADRADLVKFESALHQEWTAAQGEVQTLGWGEYKKQHMAEYRRCNVIPSKPKLDLEPPNLDSTTQLIAGLEALGIPVPTRPNPKTGQRVQTTESKSLEPMEAQYPVIKLLLDYRKAKKFVTSFGEKLLAHVGPDGRIHPDYQQIGAGTGRMSCQRPNWQQVPSKGDGKKLRGLVKAGKGCELGTADFSNIELRILTNLTLDPAMLDAFAQDVDLHSDTAKRMFNLPAEWDKDRTSTEIWKGGWSYRDIAKKINFLLVYGGSPFKLAMELGIPKEEAEALVEAYFEAYRGVAKWMERTKDVGMRDLVAKTLSGRRRPFDDPGLEPQMPFGAKGASYGVFKDRLTNWKKARARIARQALNTPIQGTSADITKLALALFNERVNPKHARLVACVHDELVVECKTAYKAEVEQVIKSAMKDACDTYLTVSPVPEPKVAWADHWVKD